MPADFIDATGFGITATARRYLAPLFAGASYPPYQDSLPDYATDRT